MTIREFCKLLRKYSKKTQWHLRGKIIRSGCNNFCPITFVAKQVTGIKYSVFDYENAGEKIGLTRRESLDIAKSADNLGDKKIRKSLLKALDLE